MEQKNSVIKKLGIDALVIFAVFAIGFTVAAVADDAVVSPTDFFTQVLTAIKGLGGLPWVAKVASVILLVIASFKVTFLTTLVWSKLGNFKAWAAPILGLVAGVLSLGSSLTWPGLFAYLSAGAGAILLHELLDTVKAVPGIGAVYVTIIDIIEGSLGGKVVPV